jgi:hypothetical protein
MGVSISCRESLADAAKQEVHQSLEIWQRLNAGDLA